MMLLLSLGVCFVGGSSSGMNGAGTGAVSCFFCLVVYLHARKRMMNGMKTQKKTSKNCSVPVFELLFLNS